MNKFKNISLSKGAFALVLLIYVSSMLVLVPYKYSNLNGEVESQGLELVKREMFRLQQLVITEFRDGEPHHAENQILPMALDSNIVDLVLLGVDNSIIYATKISWKGQKIGEVLPSYKKSLFEEVRLENSAKTIFSSDRNSLLAVYPINFPSAGKSLRDHELGALYLKYDLGRAKSAVWHRLIQENLFGFLVSLIGAIFLVIFIHRTASRPLNRLVVSSQKLAAGDLESRVELEGARELVQLEQAFNEMGSQLSDSH